METFDNKLLGAQIRDAIRKWSDSRPRSVMSASGHLGMSDIGGCREYARLITTEAEPTDERETWAADVGTAIHAMLEEALVLDYGDAALTGVTTTVRLPSGVTIQGSPDVVLPHLNGVIDIKTKDGLATIRRHGPDYQHKVQVNGYAKGLMDDGVLDPGETVWCILAYVDRSGQDSEVVVHSFEYDPLLLTAADDWISDVVYAVKHNEVASRDKPFNFCERFCEFFSACRGSDVVIEGGLIEDPEVGEWIDRYNEGAALAKEGDQLKREARDHLVGVSGSTREYEVRWTRVNEAEIAGYVRNGYDRLTIRSLTKEGR